MGLLVLVLVSHPRGDEETLGRLIGLQSGPFLLPFHAAKFFVIIVKSIQKITGLNWRIRSCCGPFQ